MKYRLYIFFNNWQEGYRFDDETNKPRTVKIVASLAAVCCLCLFVFFAFLNRQDVDIYVDGKNVATCKVPSQATVADVLMQAGTELSYNDSVYPALDSKIKNVSRVDIFRAREIAITYQGEVYLLSTSLAGYGALRQAGVYLGDSDSLSVNNDGTQFSVATEEKTEETQVIVLAHESQTKENNQEYKDYKKVLTEGKDGSAVATVTTTYINGQAVKTEQLITEIISTPVTEVVEVGTKERPMIKPPNVTYASGGGAVSRSYIANVSAYCACPICCGIYSNGYTATGAKATQYVTIAAPRNIPFGTRIYIPYFKDAPNGGIFVVQDRGGAITNNRLDVYFDSHRAALNFGRKNLEVHILE
ncbi:MAG: 3D domain-containing protein [Eubacteriales bacterium]